MTREEMEESFAEAEASLRLEGMDPCTSAVYRELKERVLAGEITSKQAKAEVIRRCTNPAGVAEAA